MSTPANSRAPSAPNRLALEASPYLLQHAHNPVDWLPWGEEAFDKARREDKPIFLSVGYSTCHWCHVMAHESFEDPAVAALLNRHFVPVKVDREERPDVDRLYMSYVQAVTRGAGGWPMSVWLTPGLQPFYGGTYFPPDDLYGRPGFARVLESLAEAWRTARPQLEAAAGETVEKLREHLSRAAPAAAPGEAALAAAASAFLSSYDAESGGFGGAPKFPRPSVFAFLLRHHARTGDRGSLGAALHTLRAMACGGVCDQLGGGFHRYAVDARWRIPHFEKMLYDQAQLAGAYLEACALTGERQYADVARDTLAYVRRDLTGPEGQFYAAEDADSAVAGTAGERAEGAFYTWTEREVLAALGEPEGRRFVAAFGLDRAGDLDGGRHTLALLCDDARELLARHRGRLLAARAGRPRPHRDEKVLAAWNGQMISAFARAYQLLEEPADLAAAQRAAAFVRLRLADRASGLLLRCPAAPSGAEVGGFAEDYACLIQGLLDLYEADFDPAHIEWALALQGQQDALFWDEASGGYFGSAAGAADVLIRIKEAHDGAEPAAGSVSAMNLLRLAAITGLACHRRRADELLAWFGARLGDRPESLPLALAALEVSRCAPRQVVVAGARDADDTRALLRAVRRRFAPACVVLLADGGAGQALLSRFQPSVAAMRPVGGRAAAYVCQSFACREPATSADALARLLEA
jgi:uncharacterized protein YyaL (SSP411 family)